MRTEASPFKFLDSYTKEDKDIFFGRENEVEEIYSRVFQSNLLLVYGASGTGKSSLIQCGLANKFEEADWQPISIRRGRNINDSMLQQFDKLALTPLKPSKDASKKLVKPLKSIYLDYFKPIYLIFDQFEELFIFGEREEWMEFISNIKNVIDSDVNVKFIFVIRGEYLEFLSEFEEIIPEFFNNRIRIEKMTRQNAVRCIEGPCEQFNIALESGFADQLLHKLSPEKAEIELTYLQVFLDRIYKSSQLSSEEAITFTNDRLEQLGNIGDVLSEFLDEQIDHTENKELSLALLKAFVTSQGTKKQVSVEEAANFVKVLGHDISDSDTDKIIQDLVNRRILKDKDEADRYELRHDSIAAKIYQKITQYERDLIEVKQFLEYAFEEHKKRHFLLNESDLAYVLPFRDRLVLSNELNEFIDKSATTVAKKKRGRKQLYLIVASISILLITSVGFLFYAMDQKAQADASAKLASIQSENAEAAKIVAEQQAELALIEKTRADSSAKVAVIQFELAEQEKERVEELRIQAVKAAQNAERQRSLAETAQQEALQSAELAKQQEIIAQDQREFAEAERLKADRLRILSIAQSLATKSLQVRDPELQSLLALQAFNFHSRNEGYTLQPDIFKALYYAKKSLFGENYNSIDLHDGAVQKIIPQDESYLSIGNDGTIKKIQSNSIVEAISTDYIINSATDDPESYRFAIGTQEGIVEVYDTKTLELIGSKKLSEFGIWQLGLISLPEGRGFVDNNGKWDTNIPDPWESQVVYGFNEKVEYDEKIYASIQFGNQGVEPSGTDQSNIYWALVGKVISRVAQTEVLALDEDNNFIIWQLDSDTIDSITLKEISVTSVSFLNSRVSIFYEDNTYQIFDRLNADFIFEGKLDQDQSVTEAWGDNSIGKGYIGFSDGTLLAGQNSTESIAFTDQKASIESIDYFENEKLVLSTSMDRSILIWSEESFYELPLQINDFSNWVTAGSFDPYNNSVLAGDASGNVKTIPLSTVQLSNSLCSKLTRNMTKEEWEKFIGSEMDLEMTCENLSLSND